MAKKTSAEPVKKKRQGIVNRIMFGSDSKPDLTPEKSKMNSWERFKYLFFNRFGTMAALNLLTVLFAIPGIFVYVIFYLNMSMTNGFVPYSSNTGIGYPVVTDAVRLGIVTNFTYQTMMVALLIPCIMVFALGVAGNMYVMRKLIWEEPTTTVKDFFRGIKKCWGGALCIGLALGLTLMLFFFSLGYFDAYPSSNAVKVVTIVVSTLLLVFMVMFSAFFMTQHVAFSMRPMVLIRNSMLFVLISNIPGLIFIGIAVAPVFLWLIPGMTMFIAMLYVFLGISFTTLVMSVYCHHCFKKFLYDKIDDSPVYTKRKSDIVESAEKNAKKRQAVPYKNPKKMHSKKSIDEGATITPLAPTFRREDLERLQKEHEAVLSETDDDDLGELDDDLPQDISDQNDGMGSEAQSSSNVDGEALS